MYVSSAPCHVTIKGIKVMNLCMPLTWQLSSSSYFMLCISLCCLKQCDKRFKEDDKVLNLYSIPVSIYFCSFLLILMLTWLQAKSFYRRYLEKVGACSSSSPNICMCMFNLCTGIMQAWFPYLTEQAVLFLILKSVNMLPWMIVHMLIYHDAEMMVTMITTAVETTMSTTVNFCFDCLVQHGFLVVLR